MRIQEEFRLNGEEIMGKIRELIRQGNIRRVIIRDRAGREVMSFPLTVGLAGALLAPTLAALGAAVALLSEATLVVEREDESDEGEAEQ